MPNPFYSHTSGIPVAQTRGVTSNLRAEFDLIQAGFDGLATFAWTFASFTLTGNATVGGILTLPTPLSNVNTTQAVNGAWVNTYYAPLANPVFTGLPQVPTAPVGTTGNQVASMQALINQAFTSALPAQAGNAGKTITTDGTTASWVANGAPNVVPVTGITQPAVAGSHYILINVSLTTVTLPATPASGDTVWVTWTNGLTTNVIVRNGNTIMGLAEDMTLDSTNGTVQLRFVNSSWRLV